MQCNFQSLPYGKRLLKSRQICYSTHRFLSDKFLKICQIPHKLLLSWAQKSDWVTMQEATQILDELNVAYHVEVVSAHRTPDKLFEFAENAQKNGYKVIMQVPVALRIYRA